MRSALLIAAALAALLLPTGGALGNNSLNDLRGMISHHSRLPLYNNDRLQIMVYSRQTERQGNIITSKDPVMDLIVPGVDVDRITTGPGTKIYPLGAPLATIFEFWSARLFSDGVISSSQADIDQERRKGAGSEPVFFRSPPADIDGVGFEADYDARTVLIKSEVKIVIRMNMSDPRRILESGKMPEKYEFIRLFADSMFFNFERKEIVLRGNVKAVEDRATVTCGKMTVYLDGSAEAAGAGGERREKDEFSRDSVTGINRILCEENVVISSPDGEGEPRSARADRVNYLLADGVITMLGTEETRPTLSSGGNRLDGEEIVIYRNEEKMQVNRRCRLVFLRESEKKNQPPPTDASEVTSDAMLFHYAANVGTFSGNVKVRDREMDLACRTMRLKFNRKATPGAPAKTTAAGSDSQLMPAFAADGALELAEVDCVGGVRMARRLASPDEPGQRAEAGQARLNYLDRVLTLSGDNPTLIRGEDRFSGEELIIFLEKELLKSTGNTRIVLCSAPNETASAPARPEQTTISSDSSNLDFGGNKLTFRGKVELRDPRLALDCEVMEIYLAEKPGGAKAKAEKSADALNLGSGTGGKILEKIVCSEKVFARDAKFKLNTEVLTLDFRQLPPGAPVTPGMFQSSGTELTTIHCDGKVRIERLADAPEEKKAAKEPAETSRLAGLLEGSGGVGGMILTADRGKVDIPGNLSEFHGKVKVVEERGIMESDALYLYSRDVAPAGSAEPEKPAGPAIDREPFEMAAESDIPTRVAIGEGKELTRVVGEKNVIITRKLPEGGIQRATGEKVVYDVAGRDIVLTGTPKKLPVLHDPSRGRMTGPEIRVDLVNETVQVEGRGTGRGTVTIENQDMLKF